jgi:hypothetical protein
MSLSKSGHHHGHPHISVKGLTPVQLEFMAEAIAELLNRFLLKIESHGWASDAVQTTVTWTLKRINVRRFKPKIEAKITTSTGSQTLPGAKMQLPAAPPYRTRLDADLRELLESAAGHIVRLVIVLDDPDFEFPAKTELAITAGDAISVEMFADLSVSADRKTATFYCKQMPGPGPVFGKFNIGVLVKDTDDSQFITPIFIDPGIGNR